MVVFLGIFRGSWEMDRLLTALVLRPPLHIRKFCSIHEISYLKLNKPHNFSNPSNKNVILSLPSYPPTSSSILFLAALWGLSFVLMTSFLSLQAFSPRGETKDTHNLWSIQFGLLILFFCKSYLPAACLCFASTKLSRVWTDWNE